MVKTVDEIKKEMEANSAAWHSAPSGDATTKGTKEWYAAENQRLGAQIGGKYDSASGKWSDSSGNALYTPTSTAGASGSGNSQYTGVGTHNDAGLPEEAMNQINIFKTQYNNAIANGDTAAAKAAHDAAEYLRKQYGYSGGVDGSEYIALPDDTPRYTYTKSQPTYGSNYNSEIDELLKQILNRDDFSYNAQNDPLYQQYANMYQREGDRAMRDTLAEAAAGAGGMNSYAITAAQQANNYYSSQLGDKIPELYQLAYSMYLDDKESKVQDLGILQSMDATQYNRYRDTMSDWRNDRNFAYGMYRDDVADSQWGKNFDYNAFADNRDFAYNSDWANKKWDFSVGQTDLENSRYDQEAAKEEVWKYINLGITPDADLVKKAGMTDMDVKLAAEAVKAESEKEAEDGSYMDDDNGYGDGVEDDNSWRIGALNLGLGPIDDAQIIVDLEEAGGIYEDDDGTVKWAPGWSAANYKLKLSDNPMSGLFMINAEQNDTEQSETDTALNELLAPIRLESSTLGLAPGPELKQQVITNNILTVESKIAKLENELQNNGDLYTTEEKNKINNSLAYYRLLKTQLQARLPGHLMPETPKNENLTPTTELG